ncbi:hypothetical protein T4B_6040 [Trichinella pseudospiralis]|uniref:Uncharacterized protein n=1 Tax=Trichinella pseudospiralis TaxID=6337 RepID=A0A0V1GBV8_TRIPS|nr:hypothetical protein T4B_6040 [Trichinella pseudospiralis]
MNKIRYHVHRRLVNMGIMFAITSCQPAILNSL